MNRPLPVVLLMLVLAALVCDILVHSRPVHAQDSSKVYIEVFSRPKPVTQLSIQGRQVVGFSCAENLCYVLSR